MDAPIESETLKCKHCQRVLSLDNFTKSYHRKKNPNGARCKVCVKRYNALWYECNRTEAQAYMREYRKSAKDAVFEHYGRKCQCCGETQPLFLDIDHMDNDGAEHRKKHRLTAGTQFYVWLRNNNFPANYQTLCCNCNRAKFRNGGICPHKES